MSESNRGFRTLSGHFYHSHEGLATYRNAPQRTSEVAEGYERNSRMEETTRSVSKSTRNLQRYRGNPYLSIAKNKLHKENTTQEQAFMGPPKRQLPVSATHAAPAPLSAMGACQYTNRVTLTDHFFSKATHLVLSRNIFRKKRNQQQLDLWVNQGRFRRLHEIGLCYETTFLIWFTDCIPFHLGLANYHVRIRM